MHPVDFEPAIQASKQPQTHTLDQPPGLALLLLTFNIALLSVLQCYSKEFW